MAHGSYGVMFFKLYLFKFSMDYTIRKATKYDMPQVLQLIHHLAKYENEPKAVEITIENLEENGFGENPIFYCYVGEIDGKIRGMALFYHRYSTWKGKTIHLEDLIVEEAFRRKGLGNALFKKVMEFAAERRVKRVEWAVLNWNTPAIDFYKNAGATVYDDWCVVQFDRTSYLRFLEK